MEHIPIVDELIHSKFTKGEQLYEQYIFDLGRRRFINGAKGFDENPFIRWSKLSNEERESWEYIERLK